MICSAFFNVYRFVLGILVYIPISRPKDRYTVKGLILWPKDRYPGKRN